jgi:hypothetical protein
MSEIVRVMRILVYEGEREWVEETLKGSLVPMDGIKYVGKKGMIKSALMDKFPEILFKSEE